MLTHRRMSVSIDNGERIPAHVTITNEVQIVRTAGTPTKPDPAWEFIDAAGHFHAYAGDDLPTCDPYYIGHPCSFDDHEDECEGWIETTYVCAICRESVKPGRVPDRTEFFIPKPAEFRFAVDSFVPHSPASVRVFNGDELAVFGVAEILAQELSGTAVRTELILTRVGERAITTTPRLTGQPAEDGAHPRRDAGP